MNKTDRANIAQAFKEAKEYLQQRGRGFICITLLDIAHGAEAKKVIEERLGGHSTLEEWVVANLPQKEWAGLLKHDAGGVYSGGKFGDDQMNLFRIRWLDSLVQEFS